MDIYCDESGYTGRNLLSEDQPYFVYSAVKLDQTEIEDTFSIVTGGYKMQNGEIKGNTVVKSPRGREVILEVFKKYSQNARLVFHDKKYALAGKIVEAGVEPYLKSNFHFYKSGLNIFIASGLYSFFLTKEDSAEKLFSEFELISKGKLSIEESSIGKEGSSIPLIDWLFTLISTNKEIFEYELKGGELNDKLTLDLTTTSILGLLSEWGKEETELSVICDNSKVFLDNPVFDMLQGLGSTGKRTEILKCKIGYSLKHDIEYKDSKEVPGLQVADLFSSTVFYCLKNPKDDFSIEILKMVHENCICTPASFCLLPETDIEELIKSAPRHYEFMHYILWDAFKHPKKFKNN